MKKLLYFGIFALAVFVFPEATSAQSDGYWVPCIDPNGEMVKCLVRNNDEPIRREQSHQQRQQPRRSSTTVVQQIYVAPQVYVVPAPQPIYVDRSVVVNQPVVVSESQQRTIRRQGCDYGIERYSGRWYLNCANTRETETISGTKRSSGNSGESINWRIGNSTGGYSGPTRVYW